MSYTPSILNKPNHRDTDIFLHITKTGGTTLGFPLRRMYGMWNTFHMGNQDHDGVRPTAYCDLSQFRKTRIRLIKGHIFYGVHDYCPGSTTYFTLLRDPIDRVASFHRMLKKEWPDSDVGQMSLREYLQVDHYTRNEQVRRIAGHPPEEGPCTEDTLQNALENLRSDFSVFGLTERYDESLILLKRRLGWPSYPYYVTSRVGRQENSDDQDTSGRTAPEVKAEIKKQNPLDVRLYRYAEERFVEAVKEEGEAFQNEVEQFRSRNQWFAPLTRFPLQLYRKGKRLVYKLRN